MGNKKGCLIAIIVNLSANLRNVLFVIDTTKPPPPSSGEKSLIFLSTYQIFSIPFMI